MVMFTKLHILQTNKEKKKQIHFSIMLDKKFEQIF